jgi:BASS family bile acid:Na+ symporter
MANFYVNNEYWFAVFQLVLAMFGMGATLKLNDFKDIFLEPFPASVGIAVQLIAVPIIAFIFISLLKLPVGVAVGIVLIAAIPGGSSSNIFTHLAGGNVVLSISITVITTITCLLSIPYILGLLISPYMAESFVMPTAQIMKEITLNLLLPLLAGMCFLQIWPRYAQRLSVWCIRGSILGLLIIFFGSAIAGRIDVEKFGVDNIFLVTLFVVALVLTGWLIPKFLGLSRVDSVAIEMEVVVRNINLALMLKVSLFPLVLEGDNTLGDMVLFSLLLYGAIQMILGVLLIPLRSRPPSLIES